MRFEAIPGLIYQPHYVSQAEHDHLLAAIDSQLWLTDLKRRVQHYGYRYDYKARKVDQSMFLGSLPDWIAPLAERLYADQLMPEVPDQAIINEYLPGQGIASHIDCEPCFGPVIASLTLGSGCVMMFTHADDSTQIPVFLEPCSLVIMQGEVRYQWKHGIPARKSDVYAGVTYPRGRRVSLTLRSVVLV